jgi:cytoskeletal protein CcmA (bactofilin family)
MKEIEPRETGSVNIIADGTTLEGNITTNGDIRIDGTVKGNIVSKSKAIIGRNGKVEGNITCANIDIEGFVKAESLNVANLVSLKATANLTGNIIAGKIAIEPGAEFSGTCRMQSQKSTPVTSAAQPGE